MLPSFRTLVDGLKVLPGIGEKTATRMAAEMLALPQQQIEKLVNGITQARNRIRFCTSCFGYADEDTCPICQSDRGSSSLLCVVQRPLDVWALEATSRFQGRYHVLGGVLSPIDGVGPDDIHLEELISRIAEEQVKEVLFALPATPESEATAHIVINSIKQSEEINFTHLAYGIPVGGNLEFMDQRTLGFALENRREF